MTTPGTPFPVNAFAGLAALESSHWWFRGRNRLLLWILQDKIRPISNYLEVGCGTGFVLEAVARKFPRLTLEATEYYNTGLNYAKARTPSCQFKEIDAMQMNDISCYECIGCFDVLEHIEDDDLVIENFHNALRPSGHLLLTVPQHQWLWSATDDFAHHKRRYSRKELVSKLRRAGFRVTYTSSFVSLLLPLMAAQRLSSSKSKGHEYSIHDILSIHPILNRCFYAIMLIEVWLLELGFTFPTGGSLVLVAQKP